MPHKIDISLKKQAKQSRSTATVAAIVEAGTYILTHHGPSGFTSNKVAGKAGVNIASFYQYFPNKEALLFHIIKLTWDSEFAHMTRILQGPEPSPERLRLFIHALLSVEAAEADLRQAIRAAAVDLHATAEFQTLMAHGKDLFHGFILGALMGPPPVDLDFLVDFAASLMTGFAERTTDARTPEDVLHRQADLLSDILIALFKLV